MNRIEIDYRECNGCRSCVRACFVNVLEWEGNSNKPGVAHAEDCVHCNLCELSCPRGCIKVTPDFSVLDWPVL